MEEGRGRAEAWLVDQMRARGLEIRPLTSEVRAEANRARSDSHFHHNAGHEEQKAMKDMHAFWDARSSWSLATFGTCAERGSRGPLLHLAKEVQEALADPDDLEEYADLVFLVMDACERAGFSYLELLDACWTKLDKNKARVWQKTSADAPVEHVRSASGVEPDAAGQLNAALARAKAAEDALDALRAKLREMIERLS